MNLRADNDARTMWRRFHAAQILLLAITALVLAWLFHATNLDLWLEAPYYDAVNRTFPWRYAWITKYFVHRHLKYALIVFGLAVWTLVLYARYQRPPNFFVGRERRWWVVAWAFVLVPIVIAALRYSSSMHCPWDVTDFGGYAPYFDLLTPVPAGVQGGRCFPAGFVTNSSWLLAFSLLWYPEHRLRSILIGIAALALALMMGWVQQMRGAHFLSHTLWSLWVTWAVILAIHAVCVTRRECS